MPDGVRVQKVLADAGVASRRAAEALIGEGRVTVNGGVAHLGQRIDPDSDRLEVDGRLIGGRPAPVYLALSKPAGVTSTVSDRHAALTVVDMVPDHIRASARRLYPVGRLDRESEGLLLLTNDGEWAERVLHPRFGVEREYAVALVGPLEADQARALQRGVELEEGVARLVDPPRRLAAAEIRRLVRSLEPAPDATLIWYRAVLRQGWKRQLRRMFGAVGAPVVRLVRVRIGPVTLGTLASGATRSLTQRELRALEALGDTRT